MLEHEIKALQHKLLEMAGLVEQMLRQAIESVLTRDKALAQIVVDTDDKIDLFENEIESLCIQLIALHQPVAIELRFLTTALKVNHNIERIADKSVSIAKRSIEIVGISAGQTICGSTIRSPSHPRDGKGRDRCVRQSER